MNELRGYRDLIVWQRAMELDRMATVLVKQLPLSDRFVYETQLRRAAVSVAANLAEGRERNHTAEFLQFVHTARGSLAEVETNLISIRDNTSVTREAIHPCLAIAEEVSRMLAGLSASLRRKLRTSPRSRSRE